MTERRFEKLERDFTEPELRAFKDELTRKVRDLIEKKTTRDDIVSKLNADIKIIDKEIVQLSAQIEIGFEWAEGEVIVILDDPGPGQKTIVRTDNGKIVRIEPMTSDDRQRSLKFEEPTEG